MAALDPSTVTSSAEVFSSTNTLPQIRALHKTLHVQIEEKSTRLRTQVGGSYRELLGTADSIVRMRGDNDAVQEILGKMGGRCGRAIVASKAKGLGDFVDNQERPQMATQTRLQLLDKCGLTAARVLKNGGGLPSETTRGDRLLVAAKVVVLIRLLIKRIGDDSPDSDARQALEKANKTYGGLRRKLRRAIDHVLEQEDGDPERNEILKALCAHSLVGSAGSRDVLRYFLDVRAGAIALGFDTEEEHREPNAEDVIRSLKLYTRSLLDVQAIVPTRLSQALGSLKSKPLLASPELKSLEGLRLNVYERWCGEEIQYFTPFIRHNDLDGKQARDMLTGWGKKGGSVLLDGLKKTLDHMTEFKSIMELRTNVLQLWIRDGNRAKGFDPSEMQDDLRETINARMLAVLEAKVNKLHLVGSEVKATLESWQDGVTDKRAGLWDEDGYEAALASGAAPFVQEVVNRLYGRNDAVSRAGQCYNSWFHVIGDVKEVVESLKKQRWDNDFDEVEDEETIEARQQTLSKEDPKMLRDKLDTTLDKSFETLDKQLQELWKGHSKAAVALYMLRVIRDIRRQMPDRTAIRDFGLAMVPALHETVAVEVSRKAISHFEATGLVERSVVGRLLWEGEPALPGQPSPQVFLFLRSLSHAMGDAGLDIWTSAGVDALRKHLDERLGNLWLAASEKLASENFKDEENESAAQDTTRDDTDTPTEDGDSDKKEKTDEKSTKGTKQDLFIQWAFDVLYLRSCTASSKTQDGKDSLLNAENALWKQAGVEDKAARDRMAKSAKDYWQRTSLLFGLLA
ncbi:vps51/Vps67 domain-containing protein [Sarocladium implicatum]|nr:vps51/Vps67 domain-containing protein [Sarocladium implicatum]